MFPIDAAFIYANLPFPDDLAYAPSKNVCISKCAHAPHILSYTPLAEYSLFLSLVTHLAFNYHSVHFVFISSLCNTIILMFAFYRAKMPGLYTFLFSPPFFTYFIFKFLGFVPNPVVQFNVSPFLLSLVYPLFVIP